MANLTIKIDGDLTVETVQRVREKCISSLSENASIVLDCSQMTKLDNVGILLLAQLREYANDKHCTYSLHGLGNEVEQTLTIIGVNGTSVSRSMQ